MKFEPALLGSRLDAAVEAFGSRPCTYFMGRRLSFAEIGHLSDRAAKGLQELGVGEGVKVGLLLPNTPTFVIYYHAILKAGGTVVNFSPLYSVEEIELQAQDSGTKIMVTLDLAATFDKVEALLAKGTLERAVVASFASLLPALKSVGLKLRRGPKLAQIGSSPKRSKIVRERELLANDGRYRRPAITTDAVAVLQYTGGTTGTPKGAMLTHANLSINVSQVMAWSEPDGERRRPRDRHSAPLPRLCHDDSDELRHQPGHGDDPRAEIRADRDVEADHQVAPEDDAGRAHRVQRHDAAPAYRQFRSHLPRILHLRRRGASARGEAGLRGDLRLQTHRRLWLERDLAGRDLQSADRPPKEGSIGLPLPGTELSIRSLEYPAVEMPHGETGEICISGPQVMPGYWNKPEETENAFVGRFLRTGDVGYMDEEGFIFIVDRIKDMINASGFKVYPRRIEDALYEHPAVAEVTVIGIPDAYRGEAPKAFVKLKEGEQTTAEALLEFLRAKLSKIELPAEIEFRDSLPKTMVGKHSKRELRAERAAKSL